VEVVRTGSKVIVGIVIVFVLALVWWLASPLFLNESVDEGLPPGSSTVEQKEEESTPETSQSSPEETETVFSGTFMNGEKNYKTSGDVLKIFKRRTVRICLCIWSNPVKIQQMAFVSVP